jgi:hypothetical protein
MSSQTYIESLKFKNFKRLSFGLIASLVLLWSIFNAYSFVPDGQEMRFVLLFLSYGLLGSYTFARFDVQTRLSKIPFFKSIPSFALFFVLSLLFFYFFLGILNPFPNVVLGIFLGVPLWRLLIMTFVFVAVEVSFFHVWLTTKHGILFSSVIAGFFHMFIWEGSPLLNFIGSTFLFFIFNSLFYFTSRDFKNPIPIYAIHLSYNFIKLGLILSIYS